MSTSEPGLRTILHPTDLSEASEPALQLAVEMACDHDARLIVLSVTEPAASRGDDGASAADLAVRVAELIGKVRAGAQHCRVEGQVVEGLPTESILAAAADARADLIVMGSHGRSGLGRVMVGSVAERVARSATCPVLILKASQSAARPAAGPRFPVVLVPTDFSASAQEALRVAAWLIHEQSLVVLVHVVAAVHVATEGYSDALAERLREWAEPLGTGRRNHVIREGEAALEILATASETHADLIVIPSHGRSGLSRLLMGSVAETVFRGAECPVVIVKLPGPV